MAAKGPGRFGSPRTAMREIRFSETVKRGGRTEGIKCVWILKQVQDDRKQKAWIPACAGMTGAGDRNEKAGGDILHFIQGDKAMSAIV